MLTELHAITEPAGDYHASLVFLKDLSRALPVVLARVEKKVVAAARATKPKKPTGKDAGATQADPKPATEPATRRRKVGDDRKIVVLAERNPKRPGTASYKRFALYKKAATVGEYLELGGSRTDLKWDLQRKHIKLTK